MNPWSRARKRIILLVVFLVVIILVGVPVYFFFYQAPTCFDTKQNGDETGVDCGGSCQLLCNAESLPLIMKGDPRILSIAPNIYEVAALIDNPNTSAEIYRAQYAVKIYTASSSIPIDIIESSVYVPKGTTFAIFEGPFTIEAGVVPTRAVLEWHKDTLVWKKNVSTQPEISVKDTTLTKEDSSPRLEAVVDNLSLEDVSNIDIIALISDTDGNIFAASKTFVDTLKSGEKAPIVFTWPRPFTAKAVDIKVMTRIFPDRSFIK